MLQEASILYSISSSSGTSGTPTVSSTNNFYVGSIEAVLLFKGIVVIADNMLNCLRKIHVVCLDLFEYESPSFSELQI